MLDVLYTVRPFLNSLEEEKLYEDEIEPGLDVVRKKKVIGKLKNVPDLHLHSVDRVPPGDTAKICDNCGRPIMHLCYLNGSDYTVGPDCALSLTMPDRDIADIKEYVKKEKNRAVFKRTSVKKLGMNSFPLDNKLFALIEIFRKVDAKSACLASIANNRNLSSWTRKTNITPKDLVGIRNYVYDLFYKKAMKSKPSEFEKLLLDNYGDKNTRKKDYFYSTSDSMPIFYDDNKDFFKGMGTKVMPVGTTIPDGYV